MITPLTLPVSRLHELIKEWRESASFAAKEDNFDWDADKAYRDCADELEALLRALPSVEGNQHETNEDDLTRVDSHGR